MWKMVPASNSAHESSENDLGSKSVLDAPKSKNIASRMKHRKKFENSIEISSENDGFWGSMRVMDSAVSQNSSLG